MEVTRCRAILGVAGVLAALLCGARVDRAEAIPQRSGKSKIWPGMTYTGLLHSSAVEGLENVPMVFTIETLNGSTFRGRVEINGFGYSGTGRVTSGGKVTFNGFYVAGTYYQTATLGQLSVSGRALIGSYRHSGLAEGHGESDRGTFALFTQ
jgi:hypothetical protein